MPDQVVAETAPEKPTVGQDEKPQVATGNDFDSVVAQVEAESKAEKEKQAKKPEVKADASTEGNVQGKETSPANVDPEIVDKVFIKGENGEELEATAEDIAKDFIGDDAKVVNGEIQIEIQVGDKVYDAPLQKVRQWAAMGVNANEKIRAANDALTQAETILANNPRSIQAEAEKLASQKVAHYIDALSQGKNPETGEFISDDNMRQGAENLASAMREDQAAQRLKAMEDRLNNQSREQQQREIAQRNEQLKVGAQAKIESVLNPFKKQFVKADGKTFDEKYYTLFQENIGSKLSNRVQEFRRQFGSGPDITPQWFEQETTKIVKETFPAFAERIRVMKTEPKKTTASALKPSGIQKGQTNTQSQKPKPKSSLTKSWDEEIADAYKEAGKPLKV